MDSNEKKYKNEEGTLKFSKGGLYDGVFEVYPYQMDSDDIKHVIKELVAYCENTGIPLGLPQLKKSVFNMTNDELLAQIEQACKELDLRGNRLMIEPRVKQYMSDPPPPTVVRVDLTDEEMAMVESGRKIPAIKSIRARTGLGLRDAKDQADTYEKAWEAAGRPRGGIPKPLSNKVVW